MKIFFAVVLSLMTFSSTLTSAQASTTSQKAMLQAAMQRYMDSHLFDGAILDLDLKTGDVRKLYPIETHPMILTIGTNFVLCSTLSDTDGNHYTVDYYVAPQDESYIVFRTEIDNRKPLQRLIKDGTVKRLR